YGTLTRSENRPPQSPPIGAPNIAMYGTVRQWAVSPAWQRSQRPQQMCHGTTTRSPGCTWVTPAPVSATSATHSWPIAYGRPTGAPGPLVLLADQHPHPARLLLRQTRRREHHLRRILDQPGLATLRQRPLRHPHVHQEPGGVVLRRRLRPGRQLVQIRPRL